MGAGVGEGHVGGLREGTVLALYSPSLRARSVTPHPFSLAGRP